MKPCSKNRKALAWLALDNLPPAEAQALLAHLEKCHGCRQYRDEISLVCEDHRQAAARPAEINADERFQQRLEERLRAAESGSGLGRQWAALIHSLARELRPARLAVAAVLLAVVLLFWTPARREPSLTPSPGPGPVGATPPVRDAGLSRPSPAPTLAVYRMAINRSPDALDELLEPAPSPSSRPALVFSALSRRDSDN